MKTFIKLSKHVRDYIPFFSLSKQRRMVGLMILRLKDKGY
jgi:hypothetical protein